MKKLVFIVGVALLQMGCATVPQSKAIQSAAELGEYEGLNKDSVYSVTFPALHPGPFSTVDMLNFQASNGKSEDNDMSAIMGKSRKTGEWEVLMIFTHKDGNWLMLPKKGTTPQ